jgi:NAD(P) transhydrogenase
VTTYDYDVVVIGSGPGGEGAAMQAVKNGKSVAVAEQFEEIGGNCTHRGTIPSKALRYAIFQVTEAANNPLFPSVNIATRHSFPDLLRRADEVISKQVRMRRGFYDRNRTPVMRGTARFVDPHTVQLDGQRLISAEQFVIATGSRPYRPNDVDFRHSRILDSDTVLSLAETPKSIVIYGAGVVGSEYASMFRNLGSKVNLVNTRGRLLEFLDDEISDALSYHLRDRGCLIRHNEQYESIQADDDGVILSLKSGKQVRADVLLWANGRTGNSQNLGLETIGLEADARGYLSVDENYQTKVENIYAVGDVVGFPSLASAAYTQGRVASCHIIGEESPCDWSDIPTGIYTSPEISSVGKTEKQLTEACVPYEVGHTHFKSLARAQITGRTVGMLKLLFHRDTLELLGVHCFGANASEIIHIGQAVMSQPGENNTLMYFINTTFNYPTMAEAYRVAALNGYNRLF